MPGEEIEPTETEALLQTRHELGARYDAELVAGFAERIERAVQDRVGDELARRRRAEAAVAAAGPRQLALGILSIIACIPISIVLGVQGELPALVVVLAAIVAINWAHAATGRRLP
ncbi:hypothetical protein [Nocardioides sp. 616]|uniref:hypothetical protein n=1 Tax=Nocardioides sp. 616 TaxID=2268090 RepID=UPI000CE2C010|nr:hypothetical protein [Nocardioides sp. 616]